MTVQTELVNHLEKLFDLENYFDGILVTDRDGIAVHYWRRFLDAVDLEPHEILGRSVLDIYPITEKSSTILQVLRTGVPIIDCQEEYLLSDGQRTPCIFSTIPVKSGSDVIGAIEVFNLARNYPYRDAIYLPADNSNEPQKVNTLDSILSQSQSMHRLKERVRIVATSNLAVLIYGETGTGKDLFAQALHAHSHRRDQRFIALNCAAIPGTLLESMLFGTVKGSYTGAEDQMGLFEAADGGTLFLDEINKMDMANQSKILKVIEEQRIRRIGDIEEVPVNVRIIAATNQDPESCVVNHTLRQDLYYRLNVLQLHIPPLRERKEDIRLLTRYFIGQSPESHGKNITGISKETEAFFMEYPWPGNVRELKNSIKGAVLMTKGPEIQISDFDWIKDTAETLHWNRFAVRDTGESLRTRVREYERSIVQAAVNECDTLQDAADRLKISKQSLNYKIKSLKIIRPDRKDAQGS